MCGIFGLLNKNLNSTYHYSDDKVQESFLLGKNRGPENSKYLKLDENTEFGFHRLAINGLNDKSDQPIIIDGITLICNGEIYNFRELYQQLNDEEQLVDPPQTDSDCEVIIHLYRIYGIRKTLEMLNGEFAFALHDASLDKIFMARDPHGVRALYIMENIEESFSYPIIFGSEMKMLNSLSLGKNNLNIQQFKPGHYMILDNNGIGDDKKYWTFQSRNKFIQYFYRHKYYDNLNLCKDRLPHGNIEDAFEQIRVSLSNSVKRRVTTSDRPIACLLSGGLDSSLITALVTKHYSKGQLETYSIGMPGSEDLKYSQIVADHLGTKHTQIVLSEDDFFNAIPRVIYRIESYDTTTVRASVGNYLVSQYISQNSDAKVIFNGDGSDEVTGGYMYFHKAPTEEEFDKECHRRLDDIYTYDVLRSDKSISSNGLEARTPFLDKEFVNAYLSIPIKWRYHPGNKQCEKYMLRKAFDGTGLLPDSVLWRTKEAFSDGVSSQTKSWFEIIDEKIDAAHGKKYKMGVYNSEQYSNNTPTTQEQNYYRDLFENYYYGCGNIIPYFWMPKYVDAKDSSARTLKVYSEQHNDE